MTNEQIKNYTLRIAYSNPTEVIVIVFELAQIYLDEAIKKQRENDFDGFKLCINKATNCINDLIEALDLSYDIARELLNIYLFINRELSLSIIKYDENTLTRIISMLNKLQKSFEELSKTDTSGKAFKNAQEVYAGLTYGRGTLNESTSIDANRGFTV